MVPLRASLPLSPRALVAALALVASCTPEGPVANSWRPDFRLPVITWTHGNDPRLRVELEGIEPLVWRRLLVDGSVSHLAHDVEPLAALRSRHGTFFVTGNHEYYSGADEWCAEFTRLGMRVLQNEHVVLTRGGAQLDGRALGAHVVAAGRVAVEDHADLALRAARGEARPRPEEPLEPRQGLR